MNTFVSLHELAGDLDCRVDSLVNYIKRRIPSALQMNEKIDNKKGRGGHNKINYTIDQNIATLIRNNFRGRVPLSVDLKNPCLMSLEHGTIGFIDIMLTGITNKKREFFVDKYRIDLYCIDIKLAIECDELGHKYRNHEQERQREEFLRKVLNCTFYRFNPNDPAFQLAKVCNDILLIINNTKNR